MADRSRLTLTTATSGRCSPLRLRDWRQLLDQWSQALLADEEVRCSLPAAVSSSSWLGYPGATAVEIAEAEARLGIVLPPTYRAFLAASNGWRQAGPYAGRLWSAQEIGWYGLRHGKEIACYLKGVSAARGSSSAARATRRIAASLWPALEVSDPEAGDDAAILLVPGESASDGGWAAAFFVSWSAEIEMYCCFQELLLARYRRICALAGGTGAVIASLQGDRAST